VRVWESKEDLKCVGLVYICSMNSWLVIINTVHYMRYIGLTVHNIWSKIIVSNSNLSEKYSTPLRFRCNQVLIKFLSYRRD
jgi:hypothetical protein